MTWGDQNQSFSSALLKNLPKKAASPVVEKEAVVVSDNEDWNPVVDKKEEKVKNKKERQEIRKSERKEKIRNSNSTKKRLSSESKQTTNKLPEKEKSPPKPVILPPAPAVNPWDARKKELEKVKIPDKPPEKVTAAVIAKKSSAEPKAPETKKDTKPEEEKVKKFVPAEAPKVNAWALRQKSNEEKKVTPAAPTKTLPAKQPWGKPVPQKPVTKSSTSFPNLNKQLSRVSEKSEPESKSKKGEPQRLVLVR